MGTDVIDIYVGPSRKHFVVHKNLLTSKSDYFNKALNGSFKEAAEQSITFEELEPAAFALMIGWLYKGTIPGIEKQLRPVPKPAALMAWSLQYGEVCFLK